MDWEGHEGACQGVRNDLNFYLASDYVVPLRSGTLH